MSFLNFGKGDFLFSFLFKSAKTNQSPLIASPVLKLSDTKDITSYLKQLAILLGRKHLDIKGKLRIVSSKDSRSDTNDTLFRTSGEIRALFCVAWNNHRRFLEEMCFENDSERK